MHIWLSIVLAYLAAGLLIVLTAPRVRREVIGSFKDIGLDRTPLWVSCVFGFLLGGGVLLLWPVFLPAWLRKKTNGKGNGSGGDPDEVVPVDLPAGKEADAVRKLRLMLEGHRGEDGLTRFLRDVEEMQGQAGFASDGMLEVFLGTVHAAKGLEWSVVFLPGLDEGVLPHAKSLLDRRRLEEEHRLFYVALTRAIRKVYLLGARYRTNVRGLAWECQPSRFLDYLPPETIRRA